MKSVSDRLGRHFAACAVAVAAAATSANAAIITWNINAAIPANFDGLYINIASQTTGATAGATAGWDINPYGATTLQFFASGSAPNPTTTYVRTQSSGGPSSLAVGTVIGASSTYANSTTAVISSAGVGSNGWAINSINYFGFRFNPGSTAGVVRYGYGVMQVGATAAARTLLSVSYEDSGASITVPAPGALALLGVAGLVGARRRRN
jgi:MYXO-CTERM domain-containing protein